MKKCFVILVVSIVFYSCGLQEDESVIFLGQQESNQTLSGTEIKFDSLVVSPTNLIFWNEQLIAVDQMGKSSFILIDLVQGTKQNYFGKKGMAPDELKDTPIPVDLQYFKDSLTYWSYAQGKVFNVPVENDRFLFENKKARVLPDELVRSAQAILETPDDFIVAAGGVNHKLSIYDAQNRLIKKVSTTEAEETLIQNILEDEIPLQGHIAYQVSAKKIVYASLNLNLIEIYDLNGNLQKSKSVEGPLKSYQRPIEGENKYDKLEYYFVDIHANENYIAAVYVGNQVDITSLEDMEKMKSTIILLDWNLEPLFYTEKDGIFSQICISSDSKHLYLLKPKGEDFTILKQNINI